MGQGYGKCFSNILCKSQNCLKNKIYLKIYLDIHRIYTHLYHLSTQTFMETCLRLTKLCKISGSLLFLQLFFSFKLCDLKKQTKKYNPNNMKAWEPAEQADSRGLGELPSSGWSMGHLAFTQEWAVLGWELSQWLSFKATGAGGNWEEKNQEKKRATDEEALICPQIPLNSFPNSHCIHWEVPGPSTELEAGIQFPGEYQNIPPFCFLLVLLKFGF